MANFKIHFVYEQYIEGQKVLRNKTHVYSGKDGNAAVKKVLRLHPKANILRCEKEKSS